jgi:hypothetical protein
LERAVVEDTIGLAATEEEDGAVLGVTVDVLDCETEAEKPFPPPPPPPSSPPVLCVRRVRNAWLTCFERQETKFK